MAHFLLAEVFGQNSKVHIIVTYSSLCPGGMSLFSRYMHINFLANQPNTGNKNFIIFLCCNRSSVAIVYFVVWSILVYLAMLRCLVLQQNSSLMSKLYVLTSPLLHVNHYVSII